MLSFILIFLMFLLLFQEIYLKPSELKVNEQQKSWWNVLLKHLFYLNWQGVLLVGERGIGKTSLALAIAAKAKVPLVEIKANQLEAGLWVGQSASNVRELFQTARDMVISFHFDVNVIIF